MEIVSSLPHRQVPFGLKDLVHPSSARDAHNAGVIRASSLTTTITDSLARSASARFADCLPLSSPAAHLNNLLATASDAAGTISASTSVGSPTAAVTRAADRIRQQARVGICAAERVLSNQPGATANAINRVFGQSVAVSAGIGLTDTVRDQPLASAVPCRADTVFGEPGLELHKSALDNIVVNQPAITRGLQAAAQATCLATAACVPSFDSIGRDALSAAAQHSKFGGSLSSSVLAATSSVVADTFTVPEWISWSTADLSVSQVARVEEVLDQPEWDAVFEADADLSFASFLQTAAELVQRTTGRSLHDEPWTSLWLLGTYRAAKAGASKQDVQAALRQRRVALLAERPGRTTRCLQRVIAGLTRVRRVLHPHAPPYLGRISSPAERLSTA